MYVPPHFALTDIEELHDCMQRIGICTLVTFGEELEASLIPIALERGGDGRLGILRGHLARPNAQLTRRRSDVRALAIFQGPAHYITPSWYETKKLTAKVVPTYDYVIVQARGFVRTIDDRARVRDHLATLTNEHEATVHGDWHIDDAPDDYIESMMGGVTAFELRIEELTGKSKLSQNRPAADLDGVVRGLTGLGTSGGGAMAELIERFRPER